MGATEESPSNSAAPTPSPSDEQRRPAPSMALRTYTCLRLGAVGVIAVLGASILREYHVAGDCLQGSISAYYYTSVQSVFVGALVAMGLVMIVLWGKTSFEDGALNLAGLVAPVVAFVPTAKTNSCGLTTASGADVTTQLQKAAVIKASHDSIDNNMLAYIVVVGVVLLLLAGTGVVGRAQRWAFVAERPWTYWGPWLVATVLWLIGTYTFWRHRGWFYGNAHQWSAVTLFVFIVAVVVDIGVQKWKGVERVADARDREGDRTWAVTYWLLAGFMSAGAVGIYFLARSISDSFSAHRTFILEAWMISWLAVFWLLQTWDRRHDGAPARTNSEVQQDLQETWTE